MATTSYTVTVGAGAHTITAAFTSTNTAFLNSSNTGTLTVSREDADVTPSAANPFAIKVNSPGGTGGPVTLCFDMNEVSDGSPGDTTNITSVTVNVVPIGAGSAFSPAAVLSGGGVGATRTACVTMNNVPVNVYDVTLTINGTSIRVRATLCSLFTIRRSDSWQVEVTLFTTALRPTSV